jgi:Tfp pilus assembly protein PilP
MTKRMLAIALLTAVPAAAQTSTLAHTAAKPATAARATTSAATNVQGSSSLNADIATEPHGFTYHADGRRDPFVSLVRKPAAAEATKTSKAEPNPAAGLAGLSASEVSLKGTLASRGDHVGLLQGPGGRTYIARQGDQLRDAVVRSVQEDSIVLATVTTGPLSTTRTTREIRKLLRPKEEAK